MSAYKNPYSRIALPVLLKLVLWMNVPNKYYTHELA
jgi:hypothetical protein